MTETSETTCRRIREPHAGEALRRLRSVEGQVGGLQRMIEEDRHCVDVLTQIAAVQEALTQVSKIVMRNYLESCATDAIRSDDPTKAYDELMEVIFRYRR